MHYTLHCILAVAFAGVVSSQYSLKAIVFPPPIVKDDMGLAGHMKPLGWQCPPQGPVKEYDHVLSTKDYWENHVKSRTPCVFRQVMQNSTAIENWKDDNYLREKYGELDVLVELKRENRTFSTGRMRYSEFLDKYKTDDLYVVTMLPKAMMHEIQAINSVLCGTFKNFTHESNFWMSNGGTRSVIHYDADHNLHCMITGRKDLIMVKNNVQNRKWLYMSRKPVTAGSGFSPHNPDVIDLNLHPDYTKVPWLYTTIYPGDCVYIPAIYIHQVRAYGRSLSATTLFTEEIVGHEIKFTHEGCTDEKLKEYHTMNDIDFHWTYEKGDETIDMGYMNVERLRNILRQHIVDENKKKWRYKDFRAFYIQFSHGEAQMHPEEVWSEIFNHTKKSLMTLESIKSYTRQQLKLFARSVDPPHGPKTDGLQKVSVTPGSKEGENDRADGKDQEGDDQEGDDREGDNREGDEDRERNNEGREEDEDTGGAPDLVYADESDKADEVKREEIKSQKAKAQREREAKKAKKEKENRDEL